MRVLLTDDNADLLNMLTLMLSYEPGVEVVPFEGERQKLLNEETWDDIDAALVDLMMPEISGEQVLQYLKEKHPHIRRIVLTAIGFVPAEIEELANVVLRKPANSSTILLALRSGD